VVTAQTPNASTSPESSAKEMILQASAGQGHTDSYGALLHLTALMSLDPYVPTPESDEERANWQGHGNGLRSALLCLAMHERELGSVWSSDHGCGVMLRSHSIAPHRCSPAS
jgi:hypothetical protein